MKTIVALIVYFVFTVALAATNIQSTAEGGNWTSPSTWVGNQVPAATDNVTIDGPVYVNNHVVTLNLTIGVTGSLMNGAGINWTATVNGDYANYGTCQDNSSGTLALSLNSNFSDYGVQANETVTLSGSSLVTLYQSSGASPITCTNFKSWSGTAEYQMLSDLRFENCLVDFFAQTVHMSLEQSDHGMYLSGGKLYRVYLETDGFCELELSNNGYLYSVTAEDIILQGGVFYYLDITFQNLTVSASCIINTWNGGTFNLIVEHDLICYGSIQTQAGNVYLRLYGDLFNYGTISAFYTYFMSSSNQYVYQDASVAPFSCNVFGKPTSVDSGTLWMLSDLRFVNTTVDMNNRNIIMFDDQHSYNIEISGGQLYRLTLATNTFSHLTMSNDAYMWYVNAGNLILHGIVQSYGAVYFQNVVNLGIMRSWYGSQYFYVYSNFTNWGTVSNDSDANTYVRVAGDFANYGTISCYQMAFNGTSDQYLRIGGSINVNRFTLLSQVGPATWYLDETWMAQGADYLDINPWVLGVWQPVAATPGRHITLGGGLALEAPQNLTIQETDGQLKLTWDQVPGAVYYVIQKAATPDGTFTNLPDQAYDENLSDGSVSFTLPSANTRNFYRIKAAN